MYLLIHPLGGTNDERMAVHFLESGCFVSVWASENLLVVGDVHCTTQCICTLSNVLSFPMKSFDIVFFRFKSEDELHGELFTKKKTGLIWTKLNSWSN